MENKKIADRFFIGKKLGHGAYGEIHYCTDTMLQIQVAVKIEHINGHPQQLAPESSIYKELQGARGIPNLHWIGTEGDYTFMVIDLLGPSLESLFASCNRKFTLRTTLLLADQILQRIEYFHTKGFIHRDIKPDNFVIGTGKMVNEVYIIDYGLAKRYRDKNTKAHIPFRNNKKLTGTARYCSLSTHLGIEQSRRDDLEGLAYCLIYFIKGELPWQGIKISNKNRKYERIMDKKMNMSIESLTRDLPNEFASFLYYCRSLRFDEKPDYAYCRKIFFELYIRNKFSPLVCFDWVFINDIPKKRESNECLSNHDDTSNMEDHANKKKLETNNLLEQGNAKSSSVLLVAAQEPSNLGVDMNVPFEHSDDEVAEENVTHVKIKIPITKLVNNYDKLRTITYENAKALFRDRKFRTKSIITKCTDLSPLRKGTGSIYYG